MALLMLFALVAGAATALSPCVLPVLPAVLGAGVTGGRRRPLGVVTGLVASFTFATVALVYLIEAVGLPNDLVRTLAIVTLLAFGIALLLPNLGERIEAFGSRIAPGPARVGGEGFGSGLVLGGSLGLVYTPCAGPILAGVITVSAAQDFTAGKLAVALSYAIGSAAVLYVLMMGGRRVAGRLRHYRGWVQAGMGAAMVAVALAMTADLDLRFQNAIADDLPAFLVNPSGGLETSEAVADDLASVRGGHGRSEGGEEEAAAGSDLPDLGAAPDFVAPGKWFNTGGDSLSISELTGSGRVVLVDFWTYTCINCIRTFPYLRAWDDEYRDDGLLIVGVHTPEFAFEKEADNVDRAIGEFDLSYPVVQDNDYGTWTAFGNQYWPAKYLIDTEGRVRYVHFGEGEYDTTESAIRSLLAEAGDRRLGGEAEPGEAEIADRALRTPETYLGYARAEGFVHSVVPGRRVYEPVDPAELPGNGFAFGGAWEVDEESATAGPDASLSLRFQARRVFLVLGSPRRSRELRVELDAEPVAPAASGEDVAGGTATIGEQRLYRLVDLPEAGDHTLTLSFERGISGYAFTFG